MKNNTDYLLRNIKMNNTVCIYDEKEYNTFLKEQLQPAYKYLNELNRICKKHKIQAVQIAKRNVDISFSEGQCKYLKRDFEGFISGIIRGAFKWDFYFRVDFDGNSMNNDILQYLDENWTNEDMDHLKLICSTFSYPSAAARYFFMSKFKDDGRLNIIRKMYFEDNPREMIFGRHTEMFADSDISLKYLESFLEYIVLIKDKNIKHGVALKKCAKTNKLYIENLLIRKYSEWQLYLPFCSSIINSRKDQVGNSITTDEALEKLRGMGNLLGGIPESGEFDFPLLTSKDIVEVINYWIEIPYSKFYIEKFGSFKTALYKANLIDEKALRNKFGICGIASDGHFFRSLSEQKIDNWLFNNGIKHECEPVYPYDEDYNTTKLRADWLVGDVYIEFFGLAEQDFYSKKMDKKFKLAEKLHLKCIYLYPVDLLNLSENLDILRKEINNCSM